MKIEEHSYPDEHVKLTGISDIGRAADAMCRIADSYRVRVVCTIRGIAAEAIPFVTEKDEIIRKWS